MTTEKEVNVKFGAVYADLENALRALSGQVGDAVSKIKADLEELGQKSNRTKDKVKDDAAGIGAAIGRMAGQVGAAVSRVGGLLNTIYRNVFSVHTAIVGLVGGGIVASVKGALESAAAIRDVGQAANASTRYIQEMRYAAAQNGASAEVMDDALTKLNKNLGEFRTTGAGPAATTLKQLGLDVAVMNGEFGRTDEAMDVILSRLQAVKSDADRAAMAADLFGKAAGPKLAELMKLGTDGIQAAREEARRLGLVLSDEMIAKADDADDKLNALWETLKMQGVQAIVSNADAIKKLAEEFAAAMPGIIEWLKECAKWWGILDRTPQEIASKKLPELQEKVSRWKADRDRSAAEGRPWNDEGAGSRMIREWEAEIARITANSAGAQYSDFEQARRDWQARQNPPEPPKPPTTTPGTGGGESEVDQARSMAQQRIQIDRDTELQRLDIWRNAIEQRHSMGTLGNNLYLTQAAVIVASETAIRRKAIEDELALEGLKPQQRAQLLAELEQLELDHQARMQELRLEAERMQAEARQREIEAEKAKNEQIARDRDRMANDVEGFVNRLLSGQLNAQSILMLFAQEAQNAIAKMIGQQVASMIAGEQAKTVAAGVGAAARQNIAAGENKGILGAQMVKALKSIATAAAETFANVYAYFSPIMGPFAAIPAGVAAAAVGAAKLLIPSAAGGTEVAGDGLHFLHKKEVVLPVHWTKRLGALADTLSLKPRMGGYPSLPGGDGDPSSAGGIFGRMGATWNISTLDAASFRQFLRDRGAELGEGMHRAFTDGHFRTA